MNMYIRSKGSNIIMDIHVPRGANMRLFYVPRGAYPCAHKHTKYACAVHTKSTCAGRL